MDEESYLVFNGAYCYLRYEEHYYGLYDRLGQGENIYRDGDTRVRIHDCHREKAIQIAKARDIFLTMGLK